MKNVKGGRNMLYKNQLLVSIIVFLIGGFFLLTFLPLSPNAYAGTPAFVCCDFQASQVCRDGIECELELCPGFESSPVCNEGNSRDGVPCTCPEPIPTLSQYGMIIMAGVLGLFAVIGLFVMRRSGVAKPSN